MALSEYTNRVMFIVLIVFWHSDIKIYTSTIRCWNIEVSVFCWYILAVCTLESTRL